MNFISVFLVLSNSKVQCTPQVRRASFATSFRGFGRLPASSPDRLSLHFSSAAGVATRLAHRQAQVVAAATTRRRTTRSAGGCAAAQPTCNAMVAPASFRACIYASCIQTTCSRRTVSCCAAAGGDDASASTSAVVAPPLPRSRHDYNEAELKQIWNSIGRALLRLGKSGMQPSHANSLRELIAAHPLLKIQINGSPDDATIAMIANEVVTNCGVDVVQIKGSTILVRLLTLRRRQRPCFLFASWFCCLLVLLLPFLSVSQFLRLLPCLSITFACESLSHATQRISMQCLCCVLRIRPGSAPAGNGYRLRLSEPLRNTPIARQATRRPK